MAKAYVDQLARTQALPAGRISKLQKAIQSAETSHDKKKLAKLKGLAPSLEKDASAAKNATDSTRLHSLADVLAHLAPA